MELSQEWQKSLCSSCLESPCCSHLPLCSLKIETQSDLIKLSLLSSFYPLKPAIKDNGDFILYYKRDCSNLNRKDFTCKIHNLPHQPIVCVEYKAFRCWYYKAFKTDATPLLLQLNKERIDYLLTVINFSDNGEIESVPDWYSMMNALSQIPMKPMRSTEPILGTKPLYLYTPPGKPVKQEHYKLIQFRIVFPGINFISRKELWACRADLSLQAELSASHIRISIQALLNGELDSLIKELPTGFRALNDGKDDDNKPTVPKIA